MPANVFVGAGLAGDCRSEFIRDRNSEPGEKPDACCPDTLKTSMCALPLFPTAEGPANRHPAPHLAPLGVSWFGTLFGRKG
jgi:hypothetical protein